MLFIPVLEVVARHLKCNNFPEKQCQNYLIHPLISYSPEYIASISTYNLFKNYQILNELDSAPKYHIRNRPDHIAQLVERRASSPEVVGLNPTVVGLSDREGPGAIHFSCLSLFTFYEKTRF